MGPSFVILGPPLRAGGREGTKARPGQHPRAVEQLRLCLRVLGSCGGYAAGAGVGGQGLDRSLCVGDRE